mgnify:FL=1
MIPILSPKEIKKVEKKYLSKTDNKDILQNRAVLGISKIISKENPSKVYIFFGPGMNGRDGLIAGKLIQKNIGNKNVHFISCIEKNSSKKNLFFSKSKKINIKKFDKKSLIDEFKEIDHKTIILDAIIGISSKGYLRSELSKKIKFLNNLFKKSDMITIYSLDIPSGFDPESGSRDKNTFISDEIIILGSQLKSSILNPESFKKINYVDIGFKRSELKKLNFNLEALTPSITSKKFPKRPETLYKNKFGSHLILGGSDRYPGAALLCSMSSNISGTGHTAVSTESSIAQKIIEKSPEITLFASSFDQENYLKRFSSISLGVGLSQNNKSKEIINEFLDYIKNTRNKHNIIIDADALNILSGINYWWEKLPSTTILTPHLGEFNKIYKFKDFEDIFKKVLNFTTKTNLNLLLKGPSTFIADEKEIIINTSPNGGMSKPGMGDVLTGLIGGIASYPKMKIKDAAILATYIHSNSGKLSRNSKGSTSMTASDVISFIPQVFKSIEI